MDPPDAGSVPPVGTALEAVDLSLWMEGTSFASADYPVHLFRFPVTVTAYSSTRDQTDSTPFITASNTQVRPGIVALSRDLLREFTPGAPFAFGDTVEIEGVGTFIVEDTMNARYRMRADIWYSSRHDARDWGKRRLYLARPVGDPRALSAPDLPLFAIALAD
jgi:3D (Asp-Asp-Asp) domain-containing protein